MEGVGGRNSKLLMQTQSSSLLREFFMYRIVFLMMGIVLLSVAFRLSKSVAFYYSGAMSIGIIILVTLVISQGIKRLPSRGKSRFELFLYSSMIGVGGYFRQYIRGLIQDLLMQIGISEDLDIPVCVDKTLFFSLLYRIMVCYSLYDL